MSVMLEAGAFDMGVLLLMTAESAPSSCTFMSFVSSFLLPLILGGSDITVLAYGTGLFLDRQQLGEAIARVAVARF